MIQDKQFSFFKKKKNKLQENTKEKAREPAGYRESLIVMCRPNMDPSSKKKLRKKIDNWKIEQSDYFMIVRIHWSIFQV